jgi:hypothetical protein
MARIRRIDRRLVSMTGPIPRGWFPPGRRVRYVRTPPFDGEIWVLVDRSSEPPKTPERR